MKTVQELEQAVEKAIAQLRHEKDVTDVQVMAAANGHKLSRFNFTSHIPSNGVEEPKATSDFGIGVTAVFADGSVGTGSAESSLDEAGVREALKKARDAAVKDPDFVSLPQAEFGKRVLHDYHDPKLMEISDEDFVLLSWDVLKRGVHTCHEIPGGITLKDARVIISGDIQVVRERMAIGGYAFPSVESDQSSMAVTSITAMIEAAEAKGTGFFAGRSLEELTMGGPNAARSAIRSAIQTMSGVRIPSGSYTVVFGPQATSELIHNLVTPGLTVDGFFAEMSPFSGAFLQEISSPHLSVYDDGGNPKFMGAKAITCEGLPTGKVELIRDGKLVGLLASHYAYQRILRDNEGARKLGVAPQEHKDAIAPRNGFRFSTGAGRHFGAEPSTSPANTIITSGNPVSLNGLLAGIKHGVYIGRMWYVYPINGPRAGDFTGTVVGDSYLIENGSLTTPLKPNVVRVNDNIKNLLRKITGVSDRLHPVNLWAADEAMYAPDIRIEGVRLDAIAENEKEMQTGM